MQLYKGSCHCGKVGFEVDGALQGGGECNCSMCRRKGAMMWFVPASHFRLLSPASDMATYTFNTHRIQHRFCPVCGIHTHGEANDKDGNPTVAINVRCLEDVDLDALPVHHFDGSKL